MAPETPPPPGQAWRDALDPALLRRLWRRAERPGLARPWQAQATLARHRRMVSGLPLAELLQRRAEILADGRAAWAPIVYARPAAPPAARGPDRGLGRASATPAAPPAVRATAARTAPLGAAQVVQRTPAAPATPPGTPIHPGSPAKPPPRGVRAGETATPGAVPPGPPELPVATRTAHAGLAPPHDRGGAPPPAGPSPPARPVVEAVRTARQPGAPGLVLVTAAPLSPPGGIPPGRTPSSLPIVRPGPGRNGDGDRPAPWAADAETGRAGPPAPPLVLEQVMRAPGPNGAWATPAGVPAPLPLAPTPAAARGPAGAPAAPMAPGAGPAARRPPPWGPGMPAAAGPVPAARGPQADGVRGLQARPQRAVLAPAEIDRIADKVQRRLLDRLAIERERRGTPR